MAKIYILMGKSSTGKDTVMKKLIDEKSLGLKEIVIYTTRPMREKERHGKEYFFSTEEDLARLLQEGKVVELRAYETVQGVWKYFTVNDGQFHMDSQDNYLMIGTLEAYQQFRKYFGEETVIPLYLEVPDGLRIRRALEREERQLNPGYAELCRRFLADEEDFSPAKLQEAGVKKYYQNQDLESCILEITRDIQNAIS